MELNSTQKATLKAFIENDPTLSQYPPTANSAFLIATALNTEATPAYSVWRIASEKESRDAVLAGGTQLDALIGSKREALLFAISGELDYRIAANRLAIDDFCGSQNVLKSTLQATRTRKASVLEKLFAVGNDPVIEGQITYQEVQIVMGW